VSCHKNPKSHIILPVIFYGCEIWSLAHRKNRLFADRVLRRISAPKREEVCQVGEKYSIKEKLHNLYSLEIIIRVIN
jgi:hypothetical protein